MDLLRTAIKCLFYDEKPVNLTAILRGQANDKGREELVNMLLDRIKTKENRYANETIESLKDYILDEWMDMHNKQIGSCYGHALNLLHYFANKTLVMTSKTPIVNFDKLLRWKDVSMYIGEDILIASAYAKRTLESYEWTNPIRHNDDDFNSFWDSSSHCEVHAHLNGCFETGDLSWIYNMNHPTGKDSYVIRASWIRYLLFQYISDPKIKFDQTLSSLEKKAYDPDDDIRDSVSDLAKSIGSELDDMANLVVVSNQIKWDYAIREHASTIFALFAGERWFLHKMFKLIFAPQKRERRLHQYIFLYIVLKISYRKNYVQTKQLLGLRNYRNYYHQIDHIKEYWLGSDFLYRYAAQTSIRLDRGDTLELRLSSALAKEIHKDGTDYNKQLVNAQKDEDDANNKNVSHIINIIKPQAKAVCKNGFAVIRAILKDEVTEAIETAMSINAVALNEENINAKMATPICGLDTASSDLNVRPDIVSPFIRYAVLKGIKNVTYHIAEEFYDIIDGLRAVYEVVSFISNPVTLRLGHASALGTDVKTYYHYVSHNVICPRLVLIDNLVWLVKCSEVVGKPLPDEIKDDMLKAINTNFPVVYGNTITFDLEEYWLSMHLRGDIDVRNQDLRSDADNWAEASEAVNDIASEARQNKTALVLHEIFEQADEESYRTVLYRMPSGAFESIVNIQHYLLEIVKERGYGIESCPTCNLVIGPYDRYCDLPIWKFEEDNGVCVSVNTDTKGIFATSLYEEYSMLAISMKKEGKNMQTQIIPTLKRLADNGRKQLFTPVTWN